MVITTEQELVEYVITLLESNLTDPAGRTKKWIYDDIPREDISGYPRIAVLPVSTNLDSLGIGTLDRLSEMSFTIDIYTRKRDKFTINSELKRAEQIIDYLGNEVINIIKNNYNSFVEEGIYYIIPITKTKDELDNRLVLRIVFKASNRQ